LTAIGPRHIGHRLARVKALKRFLTLVRSHLAGTGGLGSVFILVLGLDLLLLLHGRLFALD